MGRNSNEGNGPDWFTSSSDSEPSPEIKKTVARKRDKTEHRLTPEYLDQVIPMINRILRGRQPEGTNETHCFWQDAIRVIEQVNQNIIHKEHRSFSRRTCKK